MTEECLILARYRSLKSGVPTGQGIQSKAEVKLQALQTGVDSDLTDGDKLFLISVIANG